MCLMDEKQQKNVLSEGPCQKLEIVLFVSLQKPLYTPVTCQPS
jgi:hypothetical protein